MRKISVFSSLFVAGISAFGCSAHENTDSASSNQTVGGRGQTPSAVLQKFKGSDTLFGAITDSINQLGIQAELQYVGGGSGQGAPTVNHGASLATT